MSATGLPASAGGLFRTHPGTLAYSLRLKQLPVIDVIALASLYTLRIGAGAAVLGVPLSFWMLAFSTFLFLSLALVKRFSELKAARSEGKIAQPLRGRGYQDSDLEVVASMGSAAGYVAVLVLALYIQDAQTAQMYATPQIIWLSCPLLLYWISRCWLIAHRGAMHDDPVVFAAKDRTSWVIVLGFVLTFGLARVLDLS
jgi:4-hydroxybenzoate polyprenyltransferase